VCFLGWAFDGRRLSWRRTFTLSVSTVRVLSSDGGQPGRPRILAELASGFSGRVGPGNWRGSLLERLWESGKCARRSEVLVVLECFVVLAWLVVLGWFVVLGGSWF